MLKIKRTMEPVVTTTIVEVIRPDFTERVRKGANLLCERFPGVDWQSAINIDNLNLAESHSCVLGQVFVESVVNGAVTVAHGWEHYDGGVKYLFPTYCFYNNSYGDSEGIRTREQAIADHGFYISNEDVKDFNAIVQPSGDIYYHAEHLYEWLTEAWVKYLTECAQGIHETPQFGRNGYDYDEEPPF